MGYLCNGNFSIFISAVLPMCMHGSICMYKIMLYHTVMMYNNINRIRFACCTVCSAIYYTYIVWLFVCVCAGIIRKVIVTYSLFSFSQKRFRYKPKTEIIFSMFVFFFFVVKASTTGKFCTLNNPVSSNIAHFYSVCTVQCDIRRYKRKYV